MLGPRDDARDSGEDEEAQEPGLLQASALPALPCPLGEFTSPELAEDCARFLEQARQLAWRRTAGIPRYEAPCATTLPIAP